MPEYWKKLIAVLTFALVGFCIICYYNGYINGKWKSVLTSTEADMGEENLVPYDFDATDSDAIYSVSRKDSIVSDGTLTDASQGDAVKQDVAGKDWFNKSIYKYNARVDDSYFDKTVFIGDGRTMCLSVYGGLTDFHSFAGYDVNVGSVDENATISLNGQMVTIEQAVNSTDYDNYYISFGLNDIGMPDVSNFIEKITKLINIIVVHNPNAVIYVENIAPTSAAVQNTIYNNTTIKTFNDALLSLCESEGNVIYLDTAASVTGTDGYLPPDASSDGLTFNSEYTLKMLEYIRQHTVVKKKNINY